MIFCVPSKVHTYIHVSFTRVPIFQRATNIQLVPIVSVCTLT